MKRAAPSVEFNWLGKNTLVKVFCERVSPEEEVIETPRP